MNALVPAWHPLIVHFPLALIVTATALLSGARLLRAAPHGAVLATVGTWNLVLGAVAVYVALGSGLAAAMELKVSVAAHLALNAHVKSAMLSTLLVTAVGVWRGVGAAPTSRPSRLFLVLLWCTTASLIVTGYRGGQNVYRYGIGVSPTPIEQPHVT